jgi:hypothetical protein
MVQGQLVTTISRVKGEMPLISGIYPPDFVVLHGFLQRKLRKRRIKTGGGQRDRQTHGTQFDDDFRT